MGRAITTVLLLLGAVLAVVIWWSTGAPPAPEPPTPAEAAAGDPPLPPPARPEAPLPAPPAGDGPRVWIEFERTAELVPAPPPLLEVRRHGVVVDAVVDVVAGQDGGPPDDGDQPAAVFARVQLGGEVFHRRAERRVDGGLGIDLGADRPLRGKVVDRSGEPIAGARVWCGGALDAELQTDGDGAFVATVPAGGGVPVVVRADGRAWKAAFVEVARDGGAEIAIVVGAAQPFAVQAVGLDRALVGARIWVAPAAGADTEMQAWPAFAQALFAARDLDAAGRVQVPGLPLGAAVAITIGGAAAPAVRAEVVARPNAPRADLAVVEAAVVRGQVVDERGRPVVGAEVWCQQPGRALRGPRTAPLLPVDLPAPGAAMATTAADGAFAVAVAAERGFELVARRADGTAVRVRAAALPTAPLRLVLPTAVAAAVLTVPAPQPARRWSLRVDPGTGDAFVAQAADRAAVIDLGGAFVADLRVRIADADAWSQPRTTVAVVVAGAVAWSPDWWPR